MNQIPILLTKNNFRILTLNNLKLTILIIFICILYFKKKYQKTITIYNRKN